MKQPYEFTFTTILERGEKDVEVKVTCRAESYAMSVGFNEPCGRMEVTILRTEHRGSPLFEEEMAVLKQQAVDQLCYH